MWRCVSTKFNETFSRGNVSSIDFSWIFKSSKFRQRVILIKIESFCNELFWSIRAVVIEYSKNSSRNQCQMKETWRLIKFNWFLFIREYWKDRDEYITALWKRSWWKHRILKSVWNDRIISKKIFRWFFQNVNKLNFAYKLIACLFRSYCWFLHTVWSIWWSTTSVKPGETIETNLFTQMFVIFFTMFFITLS